MRESFHLTVSVPCRRAGGERVISPVSLYLAGGLVVPRPPFMLGLANKTGSKVWERRIKLHKLIEGHINRLKEEYNFTNPTVAGVFELQGVISQLSQDCINKRDQLMVCVCVCVCLRVYLCACVGEREGGAVGEKVEQLG